MTSKSPSSRLSSFLLIAFFFANYILLCFAEVQFNCSFTETEKFSDFHPQGEDLNDLEAKGYKLVNQTDRLSVFQRKREIVPAIIGNCFTAIDCDMICSHLVNTVKDEKTGKVGNCAGHTVIPGSLCTCCVL
ncbi:hypothetical protein MKW94_025053 [Papaver nudicaule]|uniref:Uncharacterized protein n=1 Tax=Papaver nudicaule TaxID=74823 RepID=A0AA41S7G2_PAPNU|nr:hypothetical protein [Papaver nudicaule]